MKNKYVNTYLSGGSTADTTGLNTVTIETFPDLIKKTQDEIEKLKKLYPKGPIYTKALKDLDLILGEIRELQINTEFQSEAVEIETSLNAARGLIEAKKHATEVSLAENEDYLKIQPLTEALDKLNTTIANIRELSEKAKNTYTDFKKKIDRLQIRTEIGSYIYQYYFMNNSRDIDSINKDYTKVIDASIYCTNEIYKLNDLLKDYSLLDQDKEKLQAIIRLNMNKINTMSEDIREFTEFIIMRFASYSEQNVNVTEHQETPNTLKELKARYNAFDQYRTTVGNKINSLLKTTHDLSGIISPTSQKGGSAHNSTCNCNQCSATYRKKYLKYKKKYLEYK